MSKFDVNRIILESMSIDKTEMDEALDKKDTGIEFLKKTKKLLTGGIGEKIYDKLHPEQPETLKDKAVKNYAKYKFSEHEKTSAENARKLAAASEGKETVAGKIAATTNKAKDEVSGVADHLAKSVNKIKDDAKEGLSKAGHKVADHLANLDYGKTGVAAGAAIAAGLGALALRKKLKKVS